MRLLGTFHRSALMIPAMAFVLVLTGAGAALAGLPSVPKPSGPPPPPPPPSGISVPAPPGNLPIPLPNFQLPNVQIPAPPVPHGLTGSVPMEHRVLLVVSAGLKKFSGRNSNSLEDRGWAGIYDFLQKSGSTLPQAQMSPLYQQVVVLDASRGKPAGTVGTFADNLRTLANNYEVVDLIIHCHGSDGELVFEDGSFRVADLATALADGGSIDVKDDGGNVVRRSITPLSSVARTHLRFVLETACYGSSHMHPWSRVGFAACAGARAIHADSWISFPTFLNWWGAGYSFGDAVAAANNADPARLTDLAASPFFLGKTVDSRRDTYGNMNVDLSSSTAPPPRVSPVQVRAGLPRATIRK